MNSESSFIEINRSNKLSFFDTIIKSKNFHTLFLQTLFVVYIDFLHKMLMASSWSTNNNRNQPLVYTVDLKPTIVNQWKGSSWVKNSSFFLLWITFRSLKWMKQQKIWVNRTFFSTDFLYDLKSIEIKRNINKLKLIE